MSNWIIQIQIQIEKIEDKISEEKKKIRIKEFWRDLLIDHSYNLSGIEYTLNIPYLYRFGIERGLIGNELSGKVEGVGREIIDKGC